MPSAMPPPAPSAHHSSRSWATPNVHSASVAPIVQSAVSTSAISPAPAATANSPSGGASRPTGGSHFTPAPQYFVDAARSHIHKRRHAHARRTYQLGLERFGGVSPIGGEGVSDASSAAEAVADLCLRWALLEQRVDNTTGARDLFKRGVRECPWEARVFCSWGLFENRAGHGSRVACALLQHAVSLDASIAPVLKWRMFSGVVDPNPSRRVPRGSPGFLAASARALPARRMAVRLAAQRGTSTGETALSGTATCDETSETTTATAATTETSKARPQPRLNHGWKVGNTWYDADGERTGPPMNYWKTSLHEKLMSRDDDLLRVARGVTGAMTTPSALPSAADVEETRALLADLERRNGISQTTRSSKLVGGWRLELAMAPPGDDDGDASSNVAHASPLLLQINELPSSGEDEVAGTAAFQTMTPSGEVESTGELVVHRRSPSLIRMEPPAGEHEGPPLLLDCLQPTHLSERVLVCRAPPAALEGGSPVEIAAADADRRSRSPVLVFSRVL